MTKPARMDRPTLARVLRTIIVELEDGNIETMNLHLEPHGFARVSVTMVDGSAPELPDLDGDSTPTPADSPRSKRRASEAAELKEDPVLGD